MQMCTAVQKKGQKIDMITDIKSDNVYAKQLQYFPDNIAPVNMTPFTPVVEIHPYQDSLSCMLIQSTRANSHSWNRTGSTESARWKWSGEHL